jgi:3-ketosteroid 9alpha-monooxygenase subunit A
MTSRFPRSPYPKGWFQVGWSHDLKKGEVKALKNFGENLVMWRGESGEVFVQDAYCLHIGAHRGVQGTVNGNDLVCPWHGWEWNGEGRNTKIPYGDDGCKPNLRIRTYPVHEWHGIIAVWFDPEGGKPEWELPVLPELLRDDYYPMFPHGARKWTVKSHIQMPVENAVDPAHIPWVHGSTEIPTVREFTPKDHSFYVEVAVRYGGGKKSTTLTPEGSKIAEFKTNHYGLGFAVIRWGETLWPTIAITGFVPVNDEYIDYYYQMCSLRGPGESGDIPQSKAARMLKMQHKVVEDDFFTWENMKYLERATFASLEAENYRKLRSWAMQFYPAEDGKSGEAAAH